MIANALRENKTKIWVKDAFKTYCKNWRALIHLLQHRPSHVNKLIRHKDPSYQGFVDASKWGVGGVWFGGSQPLAPFVWFQDWEPSVQQQLISDDNPNGSLSISNLELCGILMHWLALKQAAGPENLKHQRPAIWCMQ